MLLYLTSNQKSGLIDGAAHEMLMPSKKLVGKFSLKSFVTKDMRNYATAKFFLIDAACIEESGEDFTLALRSFQMMFSARKWALENQMIYLRSFAEKYQLNVVGESQDEASGLTFDRPGLNDFLEAVRQGQADALLTKDLTRLGRDVMQTASWIADLNTSGVGVFSVTDLTLRGL